MKQFCRAPKTVDISDMDAVRVEDCRGLESLSKASEFPQKFGRSRRLLRDD